MVAGRLAGLDPILSRSLMLAGFGLGLLALGRALRGRTALRGQALTVNNPPALWPLRHALGLFPVQLTTSRQTDNA